jgi:hypothetical protein
MDAWQNALKRLPSNETALNDLLDGLLGGNDVIGHDDSSGGAGIVPGNSKGNNLNSESLTLTFLAFDIGLKELITLND